MREMKLEKKNGKINKLAQIKEKFDQIISFVGVFI